MSVAVTPEFTAIFKPSPLAPYEMLAVPFEPNSLFILVTKDESVSPLSIVIVNFRAAVPWICTWNESPGRNVVAAARSADCATSTVPRGNPSVSRTLEPC